MNKKIIHFAALLALALGMMLGSCRHKQTHVEDEVEDSAFTEIPALDTAKPLDVDTVKQEEPVPMEQTYSGSIVPVIEKASKDYASRIRAEGGDGFIVVDKGRMKVILYDGAGMEMRSYGMACAKNFGTKHKKADSRTPEGYFHVQGVYDSTDWLYTDDNGKTSKKKGQFGPRFIRIAPQIGIHGTCAPWSIGHRASHGCIRLTNENIMELQALVHEGMPVIVIPGMRDRKVNREEGYETVYFPTKGEAIKLPDEPKKVDTVKQEEAEVKDLPLEEATPESPEGENAPVPAEPSAPVEAAPDSTVYF